MVRALTVLALAAAAVGCSADTTDLVVDLRTDFVPGREFGNVRVRLEPPGGVAATEPPRFAVVGGAGASERYFRGVRIAEISAVPASFRLRTTLFDSLGALVAERETSVRAPQDTAVTVVITRRGCGACPTAGGDPLASVCVDGRCCRVDEDACTTCAADAECPARAACTSPRCIAGVCLSEPVDSRCAAGETCDVELGCVATSADAGVGVDGGSACVPADCDDGVPCTADSCGPAGCAHAPDDGLCTAGPGGVCDPDPRRGCQYTVCDVMTCVASPSECLDAVCVGATCEHASTCPAGEACCAGRCEPAGCDDGVSCTLDSCGVSGCAHAPSDAACAAAPGGTCDSMAGCQYPTCTPASCAEGPCEMAACAGTACVRASTCVAMAEMCCAGTCVAAGCDDGNPCTSDACGTTGCTHSPRTGVCAGDGNDCTNDVCSGGVCTHPARANGAGCCVGGPPGVVCTGSACCGGSCVSLAERPNCGACGNDCSGDPNEYCASTRFGFRCWCGGVSSGEPTTSACDQDLRASPPEHSACCAGGCADLYLNAGLSPCGTCDNMCAPGQTCHMARCG